MNPRWFARAPGLMLASLGDGWAAHSPLSGASHLLNDESAAILLALPRERPVAATAVYADLAADCGLAAATIDERVAPAWDSLLSAGLVIEHAGPPRP